MTEPAISVNKLSKCYKLGAIGRHTLVDECQYLWHKLRGHDPRSHMSGIGHTATEARRAEAEGRGDQLFWALNDVTFDVQPGEVVGIIGRNGAGKSTLLKLLTRITEPTRGEVLLNGRVASLLEVGTGFHPELTGRENIYLNGTILGMKRREIDAKLDEIIAFSEIEAFMETPVKRYSSGMYVRLAFSVAAHLEPEIMLVDEVLAVGDAAFQSKCLGKMDDVARSGRTILFVSHNMASVQNLCSRCILIANGRVVADGDSSSVVQQYLATSQQTTSSRSFIEPGVERRGSGAVKIEFAEMLTLSGRPTASLPMGEGFRLRIRFRSQASKEELLALGVGIYTQTGVKVGGAQSAVTSNRRYTVSADRAREVECVFPTLNLMPSVYNLNLNIVRHTTARETLDHLEQALQFEVVQADVYGTGQLPSGNALVYWPIEWSDAH